MGTSIFARLRTSYLLFASVALAVLFMGAPPASARGPGLTAWEFLYGGFSASSDVAQCAVCHGTDPGGASWNQYGWDIRDVRESGDPNCASWEDAIQCVEDNPSVSTVPGMYSFWDEIVASSQPGWTPGNANTVYTPVGASMDQLPWEDGAGLEPYDPEGAGGAGGTGGVGGEGGMGGTGGVGGEGGMGGTGGDECNGGHDPIPPGQMKRGKIVVKPGQSIQEALDMAQEDTEIYVHAGIYEEPCNLTNALNITKSGIRLVGQSKSSSDNEKKRVIIRRTGDQRNGIVIVPPDVPAAAQPVGSAEVERTDCMGCHTDMGPPFPLHPNVPIVIPLEDDPWLYDIEVRNIEVQGFRNNGFFTEHVDGFVFDNIRSVDNSNYGIFPVLSRNGVISNSYSTGSDLDSALWVETSENVLVVGNLVENSVNGIEVSNSDDILVIDNEMRKNTIGAAILLLPDIYDNKDSAKRIDLVNNWVHDNNKENTAREGSILASIPRGQGILYVGIDDSEVSGNLVEDNDFVGIAVVDYCLPFQGTDFDCSLDPTITLEFLLDQTAEDNRVTDNILVNNGTDPDPPPTNPFPDFAAELTLLTLPAFFVGLPGDDRPYHGNCYENNQPEDASFFSLFDATIGVPLPWTPPPCE
jgi:parallel beta-helix repeat protein